MRREAVSTSSHEVLGAPCWVNLLTRDPDSAQRFYGAVLGWTFHRTRLGEGLSVAFRDGAPVAGIRALGEGLSLPVAWTAYFAVADADVTVARIRERGATVAVGPLSFGTGRAALAADPAGAVFGLWQGDVMRGWRVGRGTAPAWLELRTRDAFAAAIFYAEVLDWAGEPRRPAWWPMSRTGWSCVTATTSSRRSAAVRWTRAPTRRSVHAGTSTSGYPTWKPPWRRPPAVAGRPCPP